MDELPKRKNNRLKDYNYSRNGAYFITICTHNKVHLFGQIVGATRIARIITNEIKWEWNYCKVNDRKFIESFYKY